MSWFTLLVAAMLGGAAQASAPGVTVARRAGPDWPLWSVELVGAAGSVVECSAADAVGAFHFDRVPPGTYELRVRVEGFKLASRPTSAQEALAGC